VVARVQATGIDRSPFEATATLRPRVSAGRAAEQE